MEKQYNLRLFASFTLRSSDLEWGGTSCQFITGRMDLRWGEELPAARGVCDMHISSNISLTNPFP